MAGRSPSQVCDARACRVAVGPAEQPGGVRAIRGRGNGRKSRSRLELSRRPPSCWESCQVTMSGQAILRPVPDTLVRNRPCGTDVSCCEVASRSDRHRISARDCGHHATGSHTGHHRPGGCRAGWVRLLNHQDIIIADDEHRQAAADQHRCIPGAAGRRHCGGSGRRSCWELPCPARQHHRPSGVGTRPRLHSWGH